MPALLERFSAPVRRWFTRTFHAPSPPQREGWPAIAAGQHTLISAPTGSGKTLAAFLWCLDELVRAAHGEGAWPTGIHTLYVSPLKALGYDVERNLRQPLRGIRAACRQLRLPLPEVRVMVRTGDTPAKQRAAMLRQPPQVLITTPESLFILLSSPRALPLLQGVRYLVLDELHALCSNKRGAQLALSLERLVPPADGTPQVRIGLSATLQPLERAARFLGGYAELAGELCPRPVSLVSCPGRKQLDLQVVAPVADFSQLEQDSVWPAVHERLIEWVGQHRSTLAFVRMRAQAERLCHAINQAAGRDLARAHHGSLSPPVRRELELSLKRGERPLLVSTGTLELGIDVGSIDLVVQAGAPSSVSTGLQRVGRAGHLLDARSSGRLVALHREDLVACAVIAGRMLKGQLEPIRLCEGALDVLAQHVLSVVAMAPTTGEALLAQARRAAPFRKLTRPVLDTVLALLAGRYPAEVARGLTAKLVWERTTDRLVARPGAARLVVTGGGTIPDRGYFQLRLPDGSPLGELEEEFVFERTVGQVISFGAGSWRITDIDRQRVTVVPAPGEPAVIPFWKGGLFGRDVELGQAMGAFRRELYRRVARPAAALRWLRRELPLEPAAAENLVRYFAEQRREKAQLGTDRQVVLELFHDELGDPNLLIHCCLGNRVNAPWAMALRGRLRQRLGVEAQIVSDDNGVLIRLPAGDEPPPTDLLHWIEPEAVRELVSRELSGSAMFGTLFRESAARFLVLGTHGPGRRSPLWLQRLRAKDLQQATADLEDFPVRLEAMREALQQLMDLPRLSELLAGLRDGTVRARLQQRDRPSPVASGLLNQFIGKYMYEYDEPRAERALTRMQVDPALLEQVLGGAQAHELLEPEAMAGLERRWRGTGERVRARSADELLALVLRLGVLAEERAGEHCEGQQGAAWVAQLLDDGRLARFSLGPARGAAADGAAGRPASGGDAAAEHWLCASEDLPLWVSAHHPRKPRLDPVRRVARSTQRGAEARQLLVARLCESLGPFSAGRLARESGLSPRQLQSTLSALVRRGALRQGQFRAGAEKPLYCTPLNLQQIRRRSMQICRERVRPVPPARLQQRILERQGLMLDQARLLDEQPHLSGDQPHLSASPASQEPGLSPALASLALRPLPLGPLLRDLLPARLPGPQPLTALDEAVATGELLWTGAGPGRVLLCPRWALSALPAAELAAEAEEPGAATVREALAQRGASFTAELAAALPELTIGQLQQALWALVWCGAATNDRASVLQHLPAAEPAAQARSGPGVRGRGAAHRRTSRRPRPALSRAALQPGAQGRWSLVPRPDPPAPLDATRLVQLLVARYGLVCRELIQLEPLLNWSALYPALRQLELCGELVRGPFVESLGPAQFAPSAEVDALRREADDALAPPAVLLSAWDPALVAPALGLPLAGDGTLRRRGSTYIALERGAPVLTLELSSGKLQLSQPEDGEASARQLAQLAQLLRRGHRAVRLSAVNGEPVLRSPLRATLERLGYRQDGKWLEIRRLDRAPRPVDGQRRDRGQRRERDQRPAGAERDRWDADD